MPNKKFINRRNFIFQSTSAMSACLLSAHGFANVPSSKYKMGLQLFTVRSPMASDVTGTIKKIANIGYEDCETYGYDPVQGKYYGLKATAFKQLLADNKMITTSGHYDFTKFFDKSTDELMQYVDHCIGRGSCARSALYYLALAGSYFQNIGEFPAADRKAECYW
jgi:hypothetical protein